MIDSIQRNDVAGFLLPKFEKKNIIYWFIDLQLKGQKKGKEEVSFTITAAKLKKMSRNYQYFHYNCCCFLGSAAIPLFAVSLLMVSSFFFPLLLLLLSAALHHDSSIYIIK